MTSKDTLASCLQRRRAELGLTQAALARRVDCTRQYIAQLERGERRCPSLDVSLRLVRALGLEEKAARDFLLLSGHTAFPAGGLAQFRGEVDAAAMRLLDLLTVPALLHNHTWHIQALNAPAHGLFEQLGLRVGTGQPLLALAFEEAQRTHLADWEIWARNVVAQFKRDSSPLSSSPAHAALLGELRSNPEFNRLWRSVDPAPSSWPLMPVRYRTPAGPELTVTLARMQFVGTPDLWGIIFLPGQLG